uniref:YopX protein n=1 Tax=Phage sp. ctvTz5 TaxID=2826754 RepID=A0A8S5QRB7_9VIRU|nr:MAG TPA: YopX protein [Phage sp. ctvTz5]
MVVLLRFRAWLKEDKEMVDVEEIHFYKGEFDFIGDAITWMCKSNDCVLMQSTGLRDKNGKEIFEGDIIAIEVEDVETPINAKVFQNRKIGILMFHVFEDNEDVPMVELLEDDSVAFAVIGNIWEDGELLDVENTEEN